MHKNSLIQINLLRQIKCTQVHSQVHIGDIVQVQFGKSFTESTIITITIKINTILTIL